MTITSSIPAQRRVHQVPAGTMKVKGLANLESLLKPVVDEPVAQKAPDLPQELVDPKPVVVAAAAAAKPEVGLQSQPIADPVVVVQPVRVPDALAKFDFAEVEEDGKTRRKIVLALDHGMPCLKCAHLVESATTAHDGCHYSNGNTNCPARAFTVTSQINTKKLVQTLKKSMESGDANKILEVVSKIASHAQKELLSQEEVAKIMRRAAKLLLGN